ncbi:MAG TPA: glycosyltransferase, partial [Syntrophales bacterium]|nr:glycosyltransferase [Syntrophales bacterium]
MNDENSNYQKARIEHWDAVARIMDTWKGFGGYYHRRITEVFQFLIPTGQRLIEIGCAQGDLLASLKPSFGVGVDFSGEMITRARKRYPDLEFIQADAHSMDINQKFDFIILSDLVNDLHDVQSVFQQIMQLVTPRSRIIINSYSRLWELPLLLVKKLKLSKPLLLQNWLTVEDIAGLLTLAGFEVIRHWEEMIWPLPTPLLDKLMNRIIVKIWPFKYFALTNFIVARPGLNQCVTQKEPRVSVIVPVRNEAGNIPDIFKRVPEMGAGTELVFVEGHSSDDTYDAVKNTMTIFPHRPCKLFQQTGVGKGDAVRMGFANASGEILMILDGDLTVSPEDLPRFYDVLYSGKGEFVNGVRLIYPMEQEAMRFMNLVGNKFFSLAFSWLLGQPIKDTLCGTKVLWKEDYERIAQNRSYFGDFDPFGDFDLLFGAAKLNLKIIEMPIRYGERTYGSTNISRWRHGWLLLMMVMFATRR